MAGLWADNFCTYGEGAAGRLNMLLSAYAEITPNVFSPETTDPRTDTHSLYCTGGAADSRVRRVLGGAKQVAGLKVVVKTSNLPDANDMFAPIQFRDAANQPQVSVIIQSTGVLTARTGGLGGVELFSTTEPVFTAGSWHAIEARVYVAPGSGTLEVRVNGVTVVNITGDTDPSLTSETSQVAVFEFGMSNPNIGDSFLADIVAWDDAGTTTNDFIGDQRVFTRRPDDDTVVTDWYPDTLPNSRFSRIDDASPDEDTSYIWAENALDVSEFAHEAVPAGVSSISFVQMEWMLRKTDSGGCSVQPALVSGVDVTDGTDHALTTGYTYYHDLIELDPATGAPFTREGLDATLLRVTRTT